MNSVKLLIATLLILLLVSACGPAAPAEILSQPTEIHADPPLEATEERQISRDYVSLAIKPDVPSQTINGVTAQIDWAYADESRLAFQYTISGLDWPDGTTSDFMQSPQVTSATLPDDSFNGAVGWGNLPVEHGMIIGYLDQFLTSNETLDADEHPSIDLRVDIPVEGPSSVGPFHFEFTVPVLDGVKIENIDQTVVANNVSMTLKTFVLNPSYAETLVCFQMPSAVDWGLTASTLTLGNEEYPFSGGGLMSIAGKDFSLTDPERCSSIGFDIPYDPSVTSVTLTVPKLLASVPEVINEERVAAANQRLESTGIEFEYKNKDHGGDIVVLKQPEGWTNEQIYPLIWDALAEQYEGPWIFTVPIER
jgi:hypothetical protein